MIARMSIDMFTDPAPTRGLIRPRRPTSAARSLPFLAGSATHWNSSAPASTPLFCSKTDPDGDFIGAVPDPEVVAQAWNAWRAEVAFAERFVAEAPDLDATGNDPWRGPVSLRWVLVHMVEEHARHNGHIDLLRQRIDGAVGQ